MYTYSAAQSTSPHFPVNEIWYLQEIGVTMTTAENVINLIHAAKAQTAAILLISLRLDIIASGPTHTLHFSSGISLSEGCKVTTGYVWVLEDDILPPPTTSANACCEASPLKQARYQQSTIPASTTNRASGTATSGITQSEAPVCKR